MDETKAYYKKNAELFIESTVAIDMNSIYNRFLPHLPPAGKILDAGCGSGRDSLYFKQRGYQVTAIDSCEEFVRFTKNYAGVKARCLSFKEVEFNNEFVGIWTCASLLHLNYEDLADILTRLSRALKVGGILYTSFKYGDFSGKRAGRIFTDLNENSFTELISLVPSLKIIEYWLTEDQRKERTAEKWLNVLLSKETHIE